MSIATATTGTITNLKKGRKDSDILWIGSIPTHWRIKPLMALANEQQVINSNGEEKNVLSLSYGNIIRRDVESNFGLLPESFNGYQIVETGDIILRLTDLQNDHRSLRTGLVTEKGIITSAYLCLRFHNEVSSEYAHYCLHAYDLLKVFYGMGGGVRQSIGFWELKRLPFIIPPRHEQDAIVAFLKSNLSQVDRYIANKRREIELINEYKSSLIDQVVTKGLNPNATMKESGVEWMGKMPKHWSTKKIKHVARLQSGDSITSVLIDVVGDYPVYGGNGLRGYYSEYTHNGQYILIGRQGALCGCINYAQGKFWASEHAVVVDIIDGSDRIWLGELLRAMNLNQYSISAAQPGLAVDKIKQLEIPVPPKEEQQKIVSFLEKRLLQIDMLISSAENSIERMTEFRQSLIADAVTGKIDIPSAS